VIGYSSVSHMDLCCWLAAANVRAVSGAVLQMFSHGVIAGLLFAVVGRMVYDRTHTRKLADLRAMSLYKRLPFAATVFVLAGWPRWACRVSAASCRAHDPDRTWQTAPWAAVLAAVACWSPPHSRCA